MKLYEKEMIIIWHDKGAITTMEIILYIKSTCCTP